MCQRHISRPARLHGKGHTHNARLHIIEAGGLGIKCKQFGCRQCFQPDVQCSLLCHNVIVHIHLHRLWNRRLARIQKLVQPRAKLHPRKPVDQSLLIRGGVGKLLGAFFQRHIGFDRRQQIGQVGAVFFLGKLRAHGLGAAKRQL